MKNCVKNKISGAMLITGFLFIGLGLFAQNTNSQKHFQIKISENGKTITDTAFDVNSNINSDELQSLMKEFNDSLFDHKMPFSNFDDNLFDFHFDNAMPGHMFRFRQQVDSMMRHTHGFDFGFETDSLINNLGTFDFSIDSLNNGIMKSFVYKFNKHGIDSIPGLNSNDSNNDNYFNYKDLDDRIVNSDTIANEDNVIVIKKIYPDKEQIIVEKKNPDVFIKKEKNGDVEIIIKKKIDKNTK